MDDSVEGPSTTKKHKIEDRGSLKSCSYYIIYIYIYIGRIASRAKDVYHYIFCMCFCLLIVTVEEPQNFSLHKHFSLLETSISLIFLVCLTQLHVLHVVRLPALLCMGSSVWSESPPFHYTLSFIFKYLLKLWRSGFMVG